MFFSITHNWTPLVGLSMIILGAGMVKLGVNEGHEVIGGGLLMLTMSRREESAAPAPRRVTPAEAKDE